MIFLESVKIRGIGVCSPVPQIVEDILNENTASLTEHLEKGWKIEETFQVGYSRLRPIDIALIMECFASVKWLVEHGADLNAQKGEGPAFLTAARYCDEKALRYLAAHGAKTNAGSRVGSNAFKEAYYGKRYENFAVIQELGLPVSKYGGGTFRSAVMDENYEVMEFFLQHGVDINYHEPDMVFPFGPSPLCVAARYGDLSMCRYLVERGADVTVAEEGGMRPYSIALERKKPEMAAYFKALEPPEYHELQNRMDDIRKFKMPKSLVQFLQNGDLHVELPGCMFQYVEFFSLADTVPVKIGRKKFLRISKTTGDCGQFWILWNPRSKKIAYYDSEHEELADVCSVTEFMAAMPERMQGIIEGEFSRWLEE